jgi:uncharacterized protein YbjT (DUF2867 family)
VVATLSGVCLLDGGFMHVLVAGSHGQVGQYVTRLLAESDLTYTILRPGSLTNEARTGRIRTGADLDREGDEIPREDVARTLVTAISIESTYGRTFEVIAGDEPIEAALENPLNDD